MTVSRETNPITFIDTNIWFYAFNQSQDQQKSRKARSILRKTPHIALSTQVINELSINLIRKSQTEEGDIRKLVRSLCHKYIVVELNRSILLKASELRVAYQFSFWDGLIVASALAVPAAILYSEDMHHGLLVENVLTIVNPFQTPSNP